MAHVEARKLIAEVYSPESLAMLEELAQKLGVSRLELAAGMVEHRDLLRRLAKEALESDPQLLYYLQNPGELPTSPQPPSPFRRN